MSIRIITDSAADFTPAELDRLRITCVPMQVVFGEDSYTDGQTLTPEIFWQRLTAGENPKTSQPSPDAFLSVFEESKAAGDEVVCITIAAVLSGTLQSAMIARDMADYAPIHIVDSLKAAIATKVHELREEARAKAVEQPEFDHVWEHKREMRDRRFTVRKLSDGVFRVEGGQVERMVIQTDWENEDAIAFLQHRFKRIGVEDALAKAGARNGDEIRIVGRAFEFESATADDAFEELDI